jgi:hypothetical protein
MAQHLGSHSVRWDDEEWEELANLLHEDNPEQHYMDSPDLGGLCLRHLNNAAAQMRRPRHMVALTDPRKNLLKAFARLRDKRPASMNVQEDEARVRRAPPPSGPPSPLKLDGQGRPLPVAREQRAKPEPAASPFATVTWDRSEWLVIAAEIDRMYPLQKYPERAHLTGLSSEDVAFAQRLLPAERQIRHIKVASFSTLIPALRDAFEDLKQQRRTAELEHGVMAEAERHARNVLDKAAAPRALPAPAATPAPATEVVAAPAPSAAAPEPVGPGEGVWAAAVSSMLGMLVDRLRPVISELIVEALNAPSPVAAPALPAAPVVVEAVPVEQSPAPAPRPKKKEMRIGIVGNRSTYATDLAREFPNVDFTCIDNVTRVDSVKNCDRVLVLTKFISHKLDGQVRRAIEDDKYTPVHGCLTDIRRVVTGLLAGRTEPAPALVA